MEDADLILELVDASQPKGDRLSENALLVLNKHDLGEDASWGETEAVRISVKKEEGVSELRSVVANRLGGGLQENSGGALIAINARHQDCLRRAEEALSGSAADVGFGRRAGVRQLAFARGPASGRARWGGELILTRF